MKLPFIVFITLSIGLSMLSSYNFAYAFFMSAASNSNNMFTAAELFPTATPSATLAPSATLEPTPTAIITPTDQPTNTPTPTQVITPTITPTPANIANHIVISEIQIDGGPSNADQDFIELYNPTDSSIDLNGYRLVKRTGNGSTDASIKSWTSSTIVQAHGFYLWANSSIAGYPASIGANTSTSSDLTSSNTIALRNGAENTGTIIDAIGWNNGATIIEGTPFGTIPGANQSVERKAYATSDSTSMTTGADVNKGNGYDTNNNNNDFILRSVSQPQNTSSSTEIP